jgi:hypothetical protein
VSQRKVFALVDYGAVPAIAAGPFPCNPLGVGTIRVSDLSVTSSQGLK